MDNFERLKNLKHNLLCVIEEEMEDIYETDTDELGKVIDMLKDIEKTMYYCTIIKAMNEKSYPEIASTHHAEEAWDAKEGKSMHGRKAYLEAKEMHNDKAVHLRELEKYVQELTTDVVDMIADSSPEEKAYLEKKMTMLATKIGQMK